jgi:hypothetical protein
MDVEGILSELKKQRRRINRAIALVEMLKPARQRKHRSNRRKLTSTIEMSRHVHHVSTTQGTSAIGKTGRRGGVIPFGLRRRA